MNNVTTTDSIELLNDLLAINNDRIEVYEKALKETKDENADLRPVFTAMIDESRTIRNELVTEVHAFGGEYESGTTASGKLYRAWMDVRAAFTGTDRHSILANCERGEDAAQDAYTVAFEEEMPAYISTMLTEQQRKLKASHNKIKALRDASK
jgi:uncharacterized protein (TIGR02284 family)